MRRALWVVLAAAGARTAAAAPAPIWSVTLEGGAEADTNVQRIETDPSSEVQPIEVLAMRAGGSVERTGRVAGGALDLAAAASARVIANDRSETSIDDVALFAASLRYIHALPGRPVALGVSAEAADAVAIDAEVGDRTFRSLGADGLLVLRSGETRRLTLAVGARDFAYKPLPEFSYTAPSATARLDLELWKSTDTTRTLELAATLGFEARGFTSDALVDACPPGKNDESCTATSSSPRHDRYSRAEAQVTYVGALIASLGYQLVVIDSNSYGESFVRNRFTLSATTALPGRLYVTGIATLQLDAYPDGLLIATDLQHTELSSLDDENRSSLQVRLGRHLSPRWSVEARGAIWRGLGSVDDFHRELAYGGLVYQR